MVQGLVVALEGVRDEGDVVDSLDSFLNAKVRSDFCSINLWDLI